MGLLAVMVVVVPAALAVSGLITGAIILADRGTTTFVDRPAGSSRYSCSTGAPGMTVQLMLPSGAVLEGITSERSSVVFQIPADEPRGTLVARVGDVVSQPVQYPPTPLIDADPDDRPPLR